jgi:hypothetical protein
MVGCRNHLHNIIVGGPEGFTCLHYCVDMQAFNTLEFLEKFPGVDLHATDSTGRTYRKLSQELGHNSMPI